MSNVSINLTALVVAILGICGVVITTKLIPLIKSKTSETDRKTLSAWIEAAVKAADQLTKSGVIDKEDRKQHVLDFLESKGYNIDLDEIEELIESFVLGLPHLLISGEDETTLNQYASTLQIDEAAKFMATENDLK